MDVIFSTAKQSAQTKRNSQTENIQAKISALRAATKPLNKIFIVIFVLALSLITPPRLSASDLSINPDLQLLSKAAPERKRLSTQNKSSKNLHPKLGRFISESVSGDFALSNQLNQKLKSPISFKATAFNRLRGKNELQVYVEVSALDDYEVTLLREAGLQIEVINKGLKKLQGWVTPKSLQNLLVLDEVVFVSTPSYAISHRGGSVTEGDSILNANDLRALGVTGKGVKVGILSDGANNWRDAAATGDLPENITRYGTCSREATAADPRNCVSGLSGTCNEGTAMAEIIHDIAPDAEIAVASVATSLEFIQGAEELAYLFDADIIVDDLGFLGEPFYEDGNIALVLDSLPKDVLLISSAGNLAAVHHEDNLDFRRVSGANIPGYHDFDPNNQDDPFHGFVVPARTGTRVIMQWNERGRPYQDSANDHSIQLYSRSQFLDESDFDNRGDFAFETICAYNPSNEDEVRFLLLPLPENHNFYDGNFTLFFLGSGAIEYPIARGSIVGHPALERVLTVGTINADEPGNDQIAFYSSQGPSEIVDPNSGNRSFRSKPDITGIDGVRVSGAGGFSSRFFGTSAAAPHVAGIAALLKSVPFAKVRNVRKAILDGAVDLGANGRDSVYGSGRIDALLAREALKVGNPLPAIFLALNAAPPPPKIPPQPTSPPAFGGLTTAGGLISISQHVGTQSSPVTQTTLMSSQDSNFKLTGGDNNEPLLLEAQHFGETWLVRLGKGTYYSGKRLVPGIYRDADFSSWGSGPVTEPTLYVYNGSGCTASSAIFNESIFTVHEVTYNTNAEITKLVAEFKQTCRFEGPSDHLRGFEGWILYDTSLPQPVFNSGPTPIIGSIDPPIALPTTSGLNLAHQNEGQDENRASLTPSNARITASYNNPGEVKIEFQVDGGLFTLDLSFEKGRIDIDPNKNGDLIVGTYQPADYPGHPGPSFDTWINTPGCSQRTGQFRIHNISFDSQGELETFVADYATDCSHIPGALSSKGSVAYRK